MITTNMNLKTGIRYGVIPLNFIDAQIWYDSSEPEYLYHCPNCYTYLKKGQDAKRCPNCYKTIDAEMDFDFIEPSGFYYKQDGYQLWQSADDMDLWVFKSPFTTTCGLCSPCAPNAGYLLLQPGSYKTYCLGADWFEGALPYDITVTFKALSIGDTFDFNGGSYFKKCTKTGARKYVSEDGLDHRIGSIYAEVYHVERKK